jgi:hypothetical protein
MTREQFLKLHRPRITTIRVKGNRVRVRALTLDEAESVCTARRNGDAAGAMQLAVSRAVIDAAGKPLLKDRDVAGLDFAVVREIGRKVLKLSNIEFSKPNR